MKSHPPPHSNGFVHEDERRSINSELWHACAGPLVSLPSVGSLVVYFPQGHSEQVAASMQKEAEPQIPNYPNLPSMLICQLHNVTLHADVETDEVYAQMTLQPVNSYNKDAALASDHGLKQNKHPTEFFCKTLTASDTSTHGGFSVPRRSAEKIFPPLDYTQTPPAQEIEARDLHDNVWKFRHIYRGQPKRHLLTTGWSVFVSAKRLYAGDAVLFIRDEKGHLLLGIRRANRQQPPVASSVLSSDSMHIGVLAAAAHAAANQSPFTVFYNPRASPSEFVIPLSKYNKAVYGIQLSLGMRFRMMFETEESGVRRYMGTITGISDLDAVRWPNSQWRNIQVGWDESSAGEKRKRVSIWEIEPVATPFFICPPPFFRPKRLREPGMPGEDSEMESVIKRSLPWYGDDMGMSNLQSLGIPGMGAQQYMNMQQRQSLLSQSMQSDYSRQMSALGFQNTGLTQNLGSNDALKAMANLQQSLQTVPGQFSSPLSQPLQQMPISQNLWQQQQSQVPKQQLQSTNPQAQVTNDQSNQNPFNMQNHLISSNAENNNINNQLLQQKLTQQLPQLSTQQLQQRIMYLQSQQQQSNLQSNPQLIQQNYQKLHQMQQQQSSQQLQSSQQIQQPQNSSHSSQQIQQPQHSSQSSQQTQQHQQSSQCAQKTQQSSQQQLQQQHQSSQQQVQQHQQSSQQHNLHRLPHETQLLQQQQQHQQQQQQHQQQQQQQQQQHQQQQQQQEQQQQQQQSIQTSHQFNSYQSQIPTSARDYMPNQFSKPLIQQQQTQLPELHGQMLQSGNGRTAGAQNISPQSKAQSGFNELDASCSTSTSASSYSLQNLFSRANSHSIPMPNEKSQVASVPKSNGVSNHLAIPHSNVSTEHASVNSLLPLMKESDHAALHTFLSTQLGQMDMPMNSGGSFPLSQNDASIPQNLQLLSLPSSPFLIRDAPSENDFHIDSQRNTISSFSIGKEVQPQPSASMTSQSFDLPEVPVNPGIGAEPSLSEGNGIPITTSWQQQLPSPPVRTFTKVYKVGSVGRSIDVTRCKNYEELRRELARMFGLEGHLEDPHRSGWQLVFVDNENDVLLLGDDPWEEFVSCVRCIRILSPSEVLQMSQEGMELLNNLPIQQQACSSSDGGILWREHGDQNSANPSGASL